MYIDTGSTDILIPIIVVIIGSCVLFYYTVKLESTFPVLCTTVFRVLDISRKENEDESEYLTPAGPLESRIFAQMQEQSEWLKLCWNSDTD
jgi:hypothetical protein